MTRARSIVVPLVGSVLLVTVLFVVRTPDDTALWNAVFDAGHAPLFGAVALLLLRLFRGRGWGTATLYGLVFVAAAAIGTATEAVQFFLERDAALSDLLRNLAGVAAFLTFRGSFEPALRGAGRRWTPPLMHLGAAALLAAVLAPIGLVIRGYQLRDAAFPVLFDFDAGWTKRLVDAYHAGWKPVDPPEDWEGPEGRVARILFSPTRSPRVLFTEPSPNWSAFERLRLEFFSAEEMPIALWLRVHDRKPARAKSEGYARKLWIRPGVNRLTVPLDEIRHGPEGRELDLRHVRVLALIAIRPPHAVELFLDSPRLE